jgi:RNA polymerase sigma-70 factor, ECF subfamily
MAKTRAGLPDEVLVVAAILGDLAAFDDLALRYRAAVVRLAQTIVGREDAEDVAQEALLLAFKALPSIEEPSRFAAWLMTITRHRAWRFKKQNRVHRAGQVEFDELLLERLMVLAQPFVDNQDTNEEMKLALENLPAEYALVLRLHFYDDMPLKRIAAFLGVPLSTVKWRIFHGKKLLREQIEILRNGEKQWNEKKSWPS